MQLLNSVELFCLPYLSLDRVFSFRCASSLPLIVLILVRHTVELANAAKVMARVLRTKSIGLTCTALDYDSGVHDLEQA